MNALPHIAEAWRLHEAGALSLDEFTEMKRGLLASPPPVAPTPPRCWHQPPAIKAPGPKGHCFKAPGHLGGMGSHPPGACCSGCGASAASPPMRGELRLCGRRSRSLRIAPPAQCRCRQGARWPHRGRCRGRQPIGAADRCGCVGGAQGAIASQNHSAAGA